PATVGIGQLGRQRPDQGGGEQAEVGASACFVLVEQGVSTGLDAGVVLREDRLEHAGAVHEVVLQRDGVLGARLAIDLAQADALDTALGKESLGCLEQPCPRVVQSSAASCSSFSATFARACAFTVGRWALGQRPSTGA